MRTLLLVALLAAAPTALAQVSLFTPLPGESALMVATGADLSPRQQEILGHVKAELGIEAVAIVRAEVDRLMDATVLELAFPGEVIVLENVRAIRRASGLNSWVGMSNSDKRTLGGELLAAFVTVDGMVVGSLRSGSYLYEVRPLTGGLHAVSRKSMVDYRQHGDDYAAFAATEAERIEEQRRAEAETPRAEPPRTGEARGTVGVDVDVLMPYATEVATAYPGAAAQALAQSIIDYSNEVYVNSSVALTLNLVHAYATPYTASGDLNVDLAAVKNDGDGDMDEVHDYRDQYGADVVALLAGTNTSGFCGLGYIDADASLAFSASSSGCGNATITHEIGHNFGAEHDPTTSGGATPTYAYGQGYVNQAGDWGTVMAYDAACDDPPGGPTSPLCDIIPYLSNPSVTYTDPSAPVASGPTGDAATADNARLHRERAPTLAAFRATTSGPGVFAASPASIEVSLASGGTTTSTAMVSNTAAAGFSDVSWTASLANVTGTPVANACTAGQVLTHAGSGGGFGMTAGGNEFGQSFVAPCTGLLASLSPNIFAGAGWTGVYRLYEGAGTGGTELASVVVSEAVPSGASHSVTGTFTSPAAVTAGATYTWFFDLTTGSTFSEAAAVAYDGSLYVTSNGNPASASPNAAADRAFSATFHEPETWVGASPRVGTLAAGATSNVDLTFDAAGLADGIYFADLVLTSNAVPDPTQTIPITLTVGTPAPQLTGTSGWRTLALPGPGTYDDLFGPWWTQGFDGSDAPSGTCNVYEWDEVLGGISDGWVCLVSQSNPWAHGSGVLTYVFADDDATTSGTQGDFPKPLAFTGTAGTAPFTFSGLSLSAGFSGDEGWHLLGNPLATAFDWDLVTFPDARLELGVHVYDPTFNTTGDFRTYVQGVGGDLPNGWVPAFQAFFVQANTDAASLEIPVGAVPGDNPSVFGRTAATEPLDPFRLQLSLVEDGVERPISTAFIATVEDAEIGPDPRDALRLPALNLPAAALSTGRPGEDVPSLVVNTLPSAVGDLDLPMSVTLDGYAPGAQSLTITWTGLLPDGWTVTLVDREAGVDLVLEDGGRYLFEVTVPEEGSDATARPDEFGPPAAARHAAGGSMSTGDRFALQIASSAVAIGDAAAVAFELLPPVPNPSQGRVRLAYGLDVAGPVRLAIFDALGREVAVLADGIEGVGTQTVSVDVSGLAPGVYVARLRGSSGTATQRLTIVR